jgi:hypothetical protein
MGLRGARMRAQLLDLTLQHLVLRCKRLVPVLQAEQEDGVDSPVVLLDLSRALHVHLQLRVQV